MRPLVSELVYSNYRFNRDRSPAIAAERWARVFGASATALEQRYQEEVRVPVVGTDTRGSLTSGDDK
jgi:hypothetical protein